MYKGDFDIVSPHAFLAGTLVVLALAAPAARALTEGDYTYITNAAGHATITDFNTSYSGPLSITNILGGCPVTAIGEWAFCACMGLTDVTIPRCITAVGNNAFYGCPVTSLTLHNDLSAFSTFAVFCGVPTRLKSVVIGDGVTNLGTRAFSGCDRLTSVSIPDSVATIGDKAFYYCESLASVSIPDSVISIGDNAFESCNGLTNLTIGAGVSAVGSSAFRSCPGLTAVTIPGSVTNIGDGAFSSCSGLTAITVDGANPAYAGVEGVLFNKAVTTLIQCPGGKTGSYAIPSGVVTIGDGAFIDCSELTAVTMPDSVTNIVAYALSGCSGLTDITVGSNNPAYASAEGVLFNKNVTTLIQYPRGKTGTYAIPFGITAIGDYAFSGCAGLTAVTIPDSVATLGYAAFAGCTALSSVVIPDSVTAVGGCVFIGCTGLTSVTIPGSVSALSDSAFAYCYGLAAILFKGTTPALGGSNPFTSIPATFYYLPGTTGWGATFGGHPTLCWNPTVHSDNTFGFSSERFNFSVRGNANIPVKVEAASNLAASVWTSVTNATLNAAGSLSVSDPEAVSIPTRFYRIVFP